MEKESVKMWLARDKDGSLYLYCGGEPERDGDMFVDTGDAFERCDSAMEISGEMFPRITWGNSPKRVAVTIEEGGQDA